MTFNKAALVTEATGGMGKGRDKASWLNMQVITGKRPVDFVPAQLSLERIANKYPHLLFQSEDTSDKISNILVKGIVVEGSTNIRNRPLGETVKSIKL